MVSEIPHLYYYCFYFSCQEGPTEPVNLKFCEFNPVNGDSHWGRLEWKLREEIWFNALCEHLFCIKTLGPPVAQVPFFGPISCGQMSRITHIKHEITIPEGPSGTNLWCVMSITSFLAEDMVMANLQSKIEFSAVYFITQNEESRNFQELKNIPHFIPIKMTSIKKPGNSECWQGCREIETFMHCSWQCKISAVVMKNNTMVPQNN